MSGSGSGSADPAEVIRDIFFLPPMAVARVGGSPTPVDSYEWQTDHDAHGAAKTVVRPTVTLDVADDGSVSSRLPGEIRFKDNDGAIRPVAPFFELWATVQDAATGDVTEKPVTTALLAEQGLALDDLHIDAIAANRKAERRTSSPTCAFIGEAQINGADHGRHRLDAVSPRTSGQTPLVAADRPIPLGTVQVIKPSEPGTPVDDHGVDTSVIRVRFTAPAGKVYSPPSTTSAPASPVPPGVADSARSKYGRIHEIVPEENRILNEGTPWSEYIMLTGQWEDSQPQDGYDGANVGDSRSWSVVDDTSDGIITATLGVRHRRLLARARFFTGPPDYAPDRRPIYSIADDLAERELPAPTIDRADLDALIIEVTDVFRRAFETSSLFNLDAARTRAVLENTGKLAGTHPPIPSQPKFEKDSMTPLDVPYVDVTPTLGPQTPPSAFSGGAGADRLPYTEMIERVHGALMEEPILLDFLQRKGHHVLELVRPPFGTTETWPAEVAKTGNPEWRDPRLFADKLHDMRMPPYMRDANLYPLSIGRRQHQLLKGLIELLVEGDAIDLRNSAAAGSGSGSAHDQQEARR